MGFAFLWHQVAACQHYTSVSRAQVRCMIAVLFMIGRGLEQPEVRI